MAPPDLSARRLDDVGPRLPSRSHVLDRHLVLLLGALRRLPRGCSNVSEPSVLARHDSMLGSGEPLRRRRPQRRRRARSLAPPLRPHGLDPAHQTTCVRRSYPRRRSRPGQAGSPAVSAPAETIRDSPPGGRPMWSAQAAKRSTWISTVKHGPPVRSGPGTTLMTALGWATGTTNPSCGLSSRFHVVPYGETHVERSGRPTAGESRAG